MTDETRPVLFVTYSYDDPDNASGLDVSGSIKASRRFADRGVTYRCERLPDGSYGKETFIETRGGAIRRHR